MNAEIETYSTYIRKQIADVHAALKGFSEEQLNKQPDAPNANSGYVIATHVLGNARAWVLGIVCGQPLRRDRPGEFVSSGTYEEESGLRALGRDRRWAGGAGRVDAR